MSGATMFGGLTLAQAAGPGGNPMVMIGYMAIIFGLFYFLMIRPQMKKEKERKKAGAAWLSGRPAGVPFAGAKAAAKVGELVSSHIIARPHEELLAAFLGAPAPKK